MACVVGAGGIEGATPCSDLLMCLCAAARVDPRREGDRDGIAGPKVVLYLT